MTGNGALISENLVVLNCLIIVGKRDHYAHYILDFLMPLYHWLYGIGRLNDKGLAVYFCDPSIEKFRHITKQFFNCTVIADPCLRNIGNVPRVMGMGWEAHNRRWLSLHLYDYVGAPRKYISDFREYVTDQLAIESGQQNKLVFVERKREDDDRGGTRRNITNHNETAMALVGVAAEFDLAFVNVVLEDMPWEEQVRLFRETKVLVAQHGASLANIIFMLDDSVVIELHKNDAEAYRYRQLCEFFGIGKHSNVVCPLDPETLSTQGNIVVPALTLAEHVRQEIRGDER